MIRHKTGITHLKPRVVTKIVIYTHEVYLEDDEANNIVAGQIKEMTEQKESDINVLEGRECGHTVTAIFLSDNSCENIFGNYYVGNDRHRPLAKQVKVEAKSPLIGKYYEDRNGDLQTTKEGDYVCKEMIMDYWKKENSPYMVKCANSQMC